MISGLSGRRTNKLIRRRHFIVGAGATFMGALASSHSAKTQADLPRSPATPLVRPADMILKNGQIITVDPASTIAQAIAIAADRIIAVGSNDAMATHLSPATRVIDLRGKTVVPGLTDGHAHMDREALRNIFPSLGRVRSIHDIQDRIAELARMRKPGEWIITMPNGAGRRGRSLIRSRPTTLSTSAPSGAFGEALCRWSPAPTPRHSSAPASRATPSRLSRHLQL